MQDGKRDSKQARLNAQLRQQIRVAKCIHPYASLRWVTLHGEPIGRYQIRQSLQYCTDCMKITRINEK